MSLNVHTIQPTGMLSGKTAALQLQDEVTQALEQGADIILVDCKGLTFMDSSGLGAMVVALKAARAADCQFCLCSLCPDIEMLFSLTDTDRVFEIYADQAAFASRKQ